MNREEFLKKLESLLRDVDASERKEALQYYEEYFEDSEKAEADVIKELGSPEEVAHSIREELAEKNPSQSFQSVWMGLVLFRSFRKRVHM